MTTYVFEKVTAENEQEALSVYLSNKAYFSLTGHTASKESLKHDMSAKPDSVPMDRKKFYIVRRGTELVGVIDYLLGYPSEKAVYVGLLLIKEKGKGHGRAIVDDLTREFLKDQYTLLALSVLENNAGAHRFWEKVGFRKVSTAVTEVSGKEVSVDYYEKSLVEK
ncbi:MULTISPECIES: GNAT family N-acetyltransferase [unclassified Enterococcus]|uniref:GNAT family N-acetyltransferase n=1 Tax=unclassified Enterococcus TaxID=2608891 RepID=UPI001A9B8DC0|nr:GNAT family N-acetyltransferase [Enterococcus sp. DIV1271a]MBO1300055.1 GNAT family N-acetyltransferase [Enterococcus sp. DIV1271a]